MSDGLDPQAEKQRKRDEETARIAAITPWLTLVDAAVYLRRGRRFLQRQVKAGRLRAAIVGGRRELLFRAEWLDQFLEEQSTPVLLNTRKRA